MWLYHKLCTYIDSGDASDRLVNAMIYRDRPTFLSLLKPGIDVNKPVKSGNTPISYAVLFKLPEFVYLLLEHKADPNFPHLEKLNKNVFLQAASGEPNSLSLVTLLVLYGASWEEAILPTDQVDEKIKATLVIKAETYKKISKLLAQQPLTIKSYQALGTLWLQESEKEGNEALRKCYLDKAHHYLAAANNLSKKEKTKNFSSSLPEITTFEKEDRRDNFLPNGSIGNSQHAQCEEELLLPKTDYEASSTLIKRK